MYDVTKLCWKAVLLNTWSRIQIRSQRCCSYVYGTRSVQCPVFYHYCPVTLMVQIIAQWSRFPSNSGHRAETSDGVRSRPLYAECTLHRKIQTSDDLSLIRRYWKVDVSRGRGKLSDELVVPETPRVFRRQHDYSTLIIDCTGVTNLRANVVKRSPPPADSLPSRGTSLISPGNVCTYIRGSTYIIHCSIQPIPRFHPSVHVVYVS